MDNTQMWISWWVTDSPHLVEKNTATERIVPSFWHTGNCRFENGTLLILKLPLNIFYFLAHLNSPELWWFLSVSLRCEKIKARTLVIYYFPNTGKFLSECCSLCPRLLSSHQYLLLFCCLLAASAVQLNFLMDVFYEKEAYCLPTVDKIACPRLTSEKWYEGSSKGFDFMNE